MFPRLKDGLRRRPRGRLSAYLRVQSSLILRRGISSVEPKVRGSSTPGTSVSTLSTNYALDASQKKTRKYSANYLAEGIAEVVQNLSESLAETSARAAEYRTRLELTERAESSLREDLERERAERREAREELSEERQRREQAERERDELRKRLEALQETPQAPEESTDTTDSRGGTRAAGGILAARGAELVASVVRYRLG